VFVVEAGFRHTPSDFLSLMQDHPCQIWLDKKRPLSPAAFPESHQPDYPCGLYGPYGPYGSRGPYWDLLGKATCFTGVGIVRVGLHGVHGVHGLHGLYGPCGPCGLRGPYGLEDPYWTSWPNATPFKSLQLSPRRTKCC